MRSSATKPVGMLRLGSLVAMLCVLGLLISRAADPKSWIWLTGESREQAEQAKKPAATAAKAPDAKSPEAAPAIARGPVTIGTDLDPEEQEIALEQFQGLSDFTLNMSTEEMPAYWRLFRWTKAQSFEQMRERAAKDALFNQFIDRQTREQQRGKLFRLDLTVRRILSYPAAEQNPGDVKTVYEIIGTTEQSQAWMYMLLTSELPPGMPVGVRVNERATFVGYFLKVQGYRHGGAGPTDKPLPAPLLIGRLHWQPAESTLVKSDWEGPWVRWLIGLVPVFGLGWLAFWLYERRRFSQRQTATAAIAPHKAAEVRDWLDTAQTNPLQPGHGPPRESADFYNN